jgi:hypothetical protein
MHCLRRVSRSFRRLVNKLDIWKPMLLPFSHRFEYISESPWHFPADLEEQLRQRLQRDSICGKRKLWCDVHVKDGSDRLSRLPTATLIAILTAIEYMGEGLCKFGFVSLHGLPPQFYACGSHQDAQSSSSSSPRHYHHGMEQRCLGCQGAVQLCEHIPIPWVTIEAHITDWQQRKSGDWQAYFDDFDVECHDSSHYTTLQGRGSPNLAPSASLDRRV